MESRSSNVLPSKHVLFFREFSRKQNVADIREFFRRQTGGGLPKVEFYKEGDENNIFLALGFDNKDQAKEIRKRFDGKDVLGDVVSIQFFKNYSKGQDSHYSSNNRYDDRDHNGYREMSRNRKSTRDVSPYRNGYENTKHSSYRKDVDTHNERNDRTSRNKDRKRQTRDSYDSSADSDNRSPVTSKKQLSNVRSSSSSSDSSATESKSKSKPKKKLKRKNRSPSPAADTARNGRYSPVVSRSRSKTPSKSKKHGKLPEAPEEDFFGKEIYCNHNTSTVDQNGNYLVSDTNYGPSNVVMRYDYLSSDEAHHLFDVLINELPWVQKINYARGKNYPEPRKSAWFGDVPYKYAGSIQPPTGKWHPALIEIRQKLESSLNYQFNSVLCNLYRTGMDSIGWHADDEPQLGEKPIIASVNLGATRTFLLKRKTQYGEQQPEGCKYLSVQLSNGSLCVMKGATQLDWLHSIPKEHDESYPRINLTFRYTHPLHSTPQEIREKEATARVKKDRYEVPRDEEYGRKKKQIDSDVDYDHGSHSPKHGDRLRSSKHLKSAITTDREMEVEDRHGYKRNRSLSSPENSDAANSDTDDGIDPRYSNRIREHENSSSNRRRKNSESSEEEPIQKKSSSTHEKDRKSRKHKERDLEELVHSREQSSSKNEKQNNLDKPEPMEEDIRVNPALSEENLPETEELNDSAIFEYSEDQRMKVRRKQIELRRRYKQDCDAISGVVKLLISKDPTLEDKLHNALQDNLLDCAQRLSIELSELINKVKVESQTS